MPREAQYNSEGDQCISESFIVQELGRSHNRTYKAHPFDFSTDIFLSTLQKDPDMRGIQALIRMPFSPILRAYYICWLRGTY